MNVQQGDIFEVKFGVPEISEMITGRPIRVFTEEDLEPVLIISNNGVNQNSSEVMALTVTSRKRDLKHPAYVLLKAQECNLNMDSVVLGDQVRTVKKKRLGKKIGHLDHHIMKKVSQAYSYNMFADASFFNEMGIQPMECTLGAFMPGEENDQQEFKSAASYQSFEEIRKKIKEHAVKYTCGFLNNRGGDLFVGVEDNGEITGIKLENHEKDQLLQAVVNGLQDSIKPQLLQFDYQIRLHPVKNTSGEVAEGYYVLQLQVNKPSNKSVVYFEGRLKVWERLNGQTRCLSSEQTIDFIRRKTLAEHNIKS